MQELDLENSDFELAPALIVERSPQIHDRDRFFAVGLGASFTSTASLTGAICLNTIGYRTSYGAIVEASLLGGTLLCGLWMLALKFSCETHMAQILALQRYCHEHAGLRISWNILLHIIAAVLGEALLNMDALSAQQALLTSLVGACVIESMIALYQHPLRCTCWGDPSNGVAV